jgi:hypothetical protein
MLTRDIILKTAENAVNSGHGNYYALPRTTWKDILDGYTAGMRVDEKSEEKLLLNCMKLV